jgi:hypothetical protein
MSDAAQSGEVLGRQILRVLLDQIPTLFGRLDFISSLRNRSSGAYEHAVLAQVVHAEDLDRLLRQQHRQIFSEWLASSLQDQKEDLTRYLHSGRDGRQATEHLSRVAAFAELMPPAAREVERQLYLTDWAILLELLHLDPGPLHEAP